MTLHQDIQANHLASAPGRRRGRSLKGKGEDHQLFCAVFVLVLLLSLEFAPCANALLRSKHSFKGPSSNKEDLGRIEEVSKADISPSIGKDSVSPSASQDSVSKNEFFDKFLIESSSTPEAEVDALNDDTKNLRAKAFTPEVSMHSIIKEEESFITTLHLC